MIENDMAGVGDQIGRMVQVKTVGHNNQRDLSAASFVGGNSACTQWRGSLKHLLKDNGMDVIGNDEIKVGQVTEKTDPFDS